MDFLLAPLSPNPVPVLLSPDWQENSSKPCDTGSPIEVISKDFPQFAFGSVDPTWPYKGPETKYAYTNEAIYARGRENRRWLRSRKERVIVVVSHAGFMRAGVSHQCYANADYRVFGFKEEEDEDAILVEWPLTKEKGGGMGNSLKENPSGIIVF